MNKVKITADGVLEIIKNIFNDEDVKVAIDGVNTPKKWKGKTVQEVLNVDYYAFKHRPKTTDEIIAELKKKYKDDNINYLAALQRGFCSVVLNNVARLFSKDIDQINIDVILRYYIQTSKIQLLESLIESANIALSGRRFSVAFETKDNTITRQAVVIFGNPIVSEVQPTSNIGESMLVDVGVQIMLYPDVASYKDYTVQFTFTDNAGELIESAPTPLQSITWTRIMVPKAIPSMVNPRNTGNINLSCAKAWVLVFEGYNNDFINYITDLALQSDNSDSDNNQVYTMTLTRKDKSYVHYVRIKDHQTTTNNDTGNEVQTLTVYTAGVDYVN